MTATLSDSFGGSAVGSFTGIVPPKAAQPAAAETPTPIEDKAAEARVEEAETAATTTSTAKKATATASTAKKATTKKATATTGTAKKATTKKATTKKTTATTAEEPTPQPAAPPTPVVGPVGEGEHDDELTTQVSVYILPAALHTVRSVKTETGMTNAAIAYEAIDAQRDNLAALVAANHTSPAAAGSLFPGRRTAGRRRGGPRRRLWSIQATDDELAVLDRLVTQTKAASRSEVIAAAVEARYGITA